MNWGGEEEYRSLRSLGFDHEMVNHQSNFVDPMTGAHTQSVERSWLDAKIKIMKKMQFHEIFQK